MNKRTKIKAISSVFTLTLIIAFAQTEPQQNIISGTEITHKKKIWNEQQRAKELVTIGRRPMKLKLNDGRIITIEVPILVEQKTKNVTN